MQGDAGAAGSHRRGPDLADRSRQPRDGGAYAALPSATTSRSRSMRKNKLIVEQAVTNQVVDMGLLTQTAEPASEVLGVETIDVVADRGYFKIEDIEACEKAGIMPYVPRPQRGPRSRRVFPQGRVSIRPLTADSYVCPAGQRLHPYSSSLLRGLKKIDCVNKLGCDDCSDPIAMHGLAITHIFPRRFNALLASSKVVFLCAKLFEGPPIRVILSGSNIDRTRDLTGLRLVGDVGDSEKMHGWDISHGLPNWRTKRCSIGWRSASPRVARRPRSQARNGRASRLARSSDG